MSTENLSSSDLQSMHSLLFHQHKVHDSHFFCLLCIMNLYRLFQILTQIPNFGHYKFKFLFMKLKFSQTTFSSISFSIVKGWLKLKTSEAWTTDILQKYPLLCNTMFKHICSNTCVHNNRMRGVGGSSACVVHHKLI